MSGKLKNQLRNPIVQQYLFEIIFPLVGYFFFDWSLLIIGVYYLLDQFVGQLLFFRRYLWIENRGKVRQIRIGFFAFVLLTTMILFATSYYLFFELICEVKNLTSEAFFDAFYTFAYEELWLLFPVMLFAYHMTDQFSFYMPRRYLNYNPIKYVFLNLALNALVPGYLLAFGWFWSTYQIPDAWVLITLIVLKVALDILVKFLFHKRILLSEN